MEKIIEYFKPQYNKYQYIIYPFINKFESNYGKFEISLDMFNKMLNYLNKKSFNLRKINRSVYQYNDMELICMHEKLEDENVNLQYLSKNYIYQEISNDFIINVVDIKTIESNCFPIINKYNNETQQEVYECKFNYIKLFLVKELNSQHFYYSFYYNKEKEDIIKKDLVLINNIIANLVKS